MLMVMQMFCCFSVADVVGVIIFGHFLSWCCGCCGCIVSVPDVVGVIVVD